MNVRYYLLLLYDHKIHLNKMCNNYNQLKLKKFKRKKMVFGIE